VGIRSTRGWRSRRQARCYPGVAGARHLGSCIAGWRRHCSAQAIERPEECLPHRGRRSRSGSVHGEPRQLLTTQRRKRGDAQKPRHPFVDPIIHCYGFNARHADDGGEVQLVPMGIRDREVNVLAAFEVDPGLVLGPLVRRGWVCLHDVLALQWQRGVGWLGHGLYGPDTKAQIHLGYLQPGAEVLVVHGLPGARTHYGEATKT
jgi:hypothetical protein